LVVSGFGVGKAAWQGIILVERHLKTGPQYYCYVVEVKGVPRAGEVR